MITIEINDGGARTRIDQILERLTDGRPLFQRIAQTLEAETEANFAAQGRPSWVPLAASTKAAREKRNGGSSVLRSCRTAASSRAASARTTATTSH